MGRLVPITVKELIRRLRELGWEGPVAQGKHPQMRKAGRRLQIPNEHGSVLSVGLLSRLLRAAGISPDEWRD